LKSWVFVFDVSVVVVVGKAITVDNISSYEAAPVVQARPGWPRQTRSSTLSEKRKLLLLYLNFFLKLALVYVNF
jgi:hypothetical protein